MKRLAATHCQRVHILGVNESKMDQNKGRFGGINCETAASRSKKAFAFACEIRPCDGATTECGEEPSKASGFGDPRAASAESLMSEHVRAAAIKPSYVGVGVIVCAREGTYK